MAGWRGSVCICDRLTLRRLSAPSEALCVAHPRVVSCAARRLFVAAECKESIAFARMPASVRLVVAVTCHLSLL